MTVKNPHWMQNPNAFYYVAHNKYGQEYFRAEGYATEELTRKIAEHVGVEHKEHGTDYTILFNAIQQKYKKIYVTVSYSVENNPLVNPYVARKNAQLEREWKAVEDWFNSVNWND